VPPALMHPGRLGRGAGDFFEGERR
jgi:hypothetical protein